jgi:FMN phosphatase YigB (HAD superfamily)
MITLILFDASDVLYTRKVSIKGYAKSLLQEAGFTRQPSPEEWQHLRAVAHSAMAKPDPSIYRIALKEGRASPEQTLFVGHATHELEGAKALGIRRVAVFKDEGARGDYEIRSLTELPPLLGNLQ